MGVLKNDVGRPSNKTIMIRRILKTIFCIILFVLCFILGYKLSDFSNKTKKDENKEIVEKLDITSKEVIDLYVPFSFHMYNMEDEELFKKEKIIIKDLSSEYKNRLAYAYYANEVGFNNMYNNTENLSSNIFKEYYKKFFGEEVKYVAKSFNSYNISSLETVYDEKSDTYWETSEGGDASFSRYANELYKAEKTHNQINLYIDVVVYNMNDSLDKFGVFRNINDAKNFENPIKEINIDELKNSYYEEIEKFKDVKSSKNSYYFDDLTDYKDSAEKYKITLEKDKENYIFKQIEKITK